MAIRFTETGYAKINLALHVRRRRDDGYHILETIFAFLDHGDLLQVDEGDDLSLKITGPFSEGLATDASNLVLQAAMLLRQVTGCTKGAQLHLEKILPVASGIGGGSADAAATLRLLNNYWRLGLSLLELSRIAEPLGADVPACVLSETCRGQGIGNELEMLPKANIAGMTALLVNAGIAVSTPEIFSRWGRNDLGPLNQGDVLETAINGRNDLQPLAIECQPAIAETIEAMADHKANLVRMSGSGATCFALFNDQNHANALRTRLENEKPSYWTMVGKIR